MLACFNILAATCRWRIPYAYHTYHTHTIRLSVDEMMELFWNKIVRILFFLRVIAHATEICYPCDSMRTLFYAQNLGYHLILRRNAALESGGIPVSENGRFHANPILSPANGHPCPMTLGIGWDQYRLGGRGAQYTGMQVPHSNQYNTQ